MVKLWCHKWLCPLIHHQMYNVPTIVCGSVAEHGWVWFGWEAWCHTCHMWCGFPDVLPTSDIPLLSLTCTSVGWITKFLQSQRTWKQVYSRPHSLGAALRSSGSLNSIMAKIQRIWLGTSFESLWTQSMPRSRTFTSMSKYCSVSFNLAGMSHSAWICWNVTQVTQILGGHPYIGKNTIKEWQPILRLHDLLTKLPNMATHDHVCDPQPTD